MPCIMYFYIAYTLHSSIRIKILLTLCRLVFYIIHFWGGFVVFWGTFYTAVP